MWPSTNLFSTGKGCLEGSGLKVYVGVTGVEAGTSTKRYSTGNGLASRETSLP